MRYYTKLDEIPIYYFMKAIKDDDLESIVYGEGSKVKFVNDNKDKLENVLGYLKQEYSKLTFSKRDLSREKAMAELLYLYGKKDAIVLAMQVFITTKHWDVFKVLNGLKGISIKEPFSKDTVDYLNKQLKYNDNKIGIKKAAFESKFGKVSDDEIKGSGDLFVDLDRQALNIETGLELGYRLDVKKVDVVRWNNLTIAISEKAEAMAQI